VVTSSTAQPVRACVATLAPAAAVAGSNWRENASALSLSQPRLGAALGPAPRDLRWVYARDGSLTAFDAAGQWLHSCSVPLRAAEALLSTLEVKGRVACLLAPTLCAQVHVTLQHGRPEQAILALCPCLDDLHTLLHCDDFSSAIRARRLWFAWGDDWATEMKQLFTEQAGLATPAQFVRLPTTPAEEVDQLVSTAQKVFADTNAARVAAIATRRDGWRPRATTLTASRGIPGEAGGTSDRPLASRDKGRSLLPRLCVVAPSQFKLWADAGAVLAETLAASAEAGRAEVFPFDPDDPARSSAAALLEAAAPCDALVAADTARADLPGVLPPDMPWITWITTPAKIPPFTTAGPRDALLVADLAWRELARSSGWPENKVAVAGWPAPAPVPAGGCDAPTLAIVSDTRPVVAPERLAEFSSHQLLWNAIAAELSSDPFALGDDPVAYLEQRMRRHGVSPGAFDHALFLGDLILPTYEQCLARILLKEGIPLLLHGHGWADVNEFHPHAAGPVTSRADLARICSRSRAIIHALPTSHAHPADSVGLPVLRRGGESRAAYLRTVRAALNGQFAPRPQVAALALDQFLPHLAY
jgi:hypothetical protein